MHAGLIGWQRNANSEAGREEEIHKRTRGNVANLQRIVQKVLKQKISTSSLAWPYQSAFGLRLLQQRLSRCFSSELALRWTQVIIHLAHSCKPFLPFSFPNPPGSFFIPAFIGSGKSILLPGPSDTSSSPFCSDSQNSNGTLKTAHTNCQSKGTHLRSK